MSHRPATRLWRRLLPWTVLSLLAAVAPRPAASQGTLSALETDVDRIASNARPSVVTVFAQSTVVISRGGVSRAHLHTRVGSAVAMEEKYLITTASVVAGAERIWVRTTNNLRAEARLVGMDPIFNLAVLAVRDIRLPTLQFSTRAPAQEGEWVMAIGTSHYRAQITQSVGTVAYRHHEPRLSLLQLTNSVYPGYSGGPVLDARGQVIGIIQGELGRSYGDGRGGGPATFVLPVETVEPVYRSLRAIGRVRHGYLGVSTRAASVKSDSEPGLDVPIGALVESVQPEGPASRVGLEHGDLIVGFDGARVEYPEQLARWVAASPPGTSVQLVWVRGEIQRTGRTVLTESPDTTPAWAKLPGSRRASGPGQTRVADLERQIRELNQELERLKHKGAPR